jgi:hypothetical protein
MTEVPGDENGALIEERVVLAKFDGDLTQEEIDTGEHDPVETITIVNGEVVDHWVKEDTTE